MKTQGLTRVTLMSLILSAGVVSGAAMAQSDPAPVPDHPRVNEINQRIDRQQDRIQANEAKGRINAQQAARDEKHLVNVQQREAVDEAKHNGHLTKKQQRHLNQSLNRNSHRIHKQAHKR